MKFIKKILKYFSKFQNPILSLQNFIFNFQSCTSVKIKVLNNFSKILRKITILNIKVFLKNMFSFWEYEFFYQISVMSVPISSNTSKFVSLRKPQIEQKNQWHAKKKFKHSNLLLICPQTALFLSTYNDWNSKNFYNPHLVEKANFRNFPAHLPRMHRITVVQNEASDNNWRNFFFFSSDQK